MAFLMEIKLQFTQEGGMPHAMNFVIRLILNFEVLGFLKGLDVSETGLNLVERPFFYLTSVVNLDYVTCNWAEEVLSLFIIVVIP
jgi:hypothetical protein